MKSIVSLIVAVGILLSPFATAQAETRYVTDRILLGIHQQPSEQSPLIKSVPSGTALTVIQRTESFTRIKLADGTNGWVSNKYLMKEEPSTARYDKLFNANQKTQQALKTANEKLTKSERNNQLLSDELSNARSTINELKKNGKPAAASNTQADPEQAQKLQAAEAKVAELTQQLEAAKTQQPVTQTSESDAQAILASLQQDNAALQARIELAVANLSGEQAPTPEELAGIRPSYPLWFWGLMVIAIIIGVIVGISWMDYQSRKRHGGFRV